MTPRRAKAIAAIGKRRIAPVREAQEAHEDRRFSDRRAEDKERGELLATIAAQADLIAHYQAVLGMTDNPPVGYRDALECEEVGRGDA